ncbi:MAG TPA: hypothetical protein DCR04_11450 [Flavobacteriales bacterium]|nr:hypothetical protein [Flavobacteriales bacterium]
MNKTAPKKHIDELHFEHKLWTSKMRFYMDELSIFENRLSELVQRNTKVEVTSEIEHFQNQFIRQREVAEQLISKCNDHEKFLANQAKEHPVAIDHVLFADHTKLRDEAEVYDKIYSELKTEFMNLLRKWM